MTQQHNQSATLHPSTFDYLKPDQDQIITMNGCRMAAKEYAEVLERLVPPGPDKTYALRQLRQLAMWVNVAITREHDGTPRTFATSD